MYNEDINILFPSYIIIPLKFLIDSYMICISYCFKKIFSHDLKNYYIGYE